MDTTRIERFLRYAQEVAHRDVYELEVDPEHPGFYLVRDVPVFAEHVRGEVTYTPEDLDKIVGHHEELTATRHYVPVFEGHHGCSDEECRPKIGNMRNLRRGEVEIVHPDTHQRTRLQAIFADIGKIKSSYARRLLDGDLEYRSVEVYPGTPRISGLALTSTVPPWFKFANLEVRLAEGVEMPADTRYQAEFTPYTAMTAKQGDRLLVCYGERMKFKGEVVEEASEKDEPKKYATEPTEAQVRRGIGLLAKRVSRLMAVDAQDGMALDQILHYVRSGDWAGAYNFARTLDTIVREEIPAALWVRMGGKLIDPDQFAEGETPEKYDIPSTLTGYTIYVVEVGPHEWDVVSGGEIMESFGTRQEADEYARWLATSNDRVKHITADEYQETVAGQEERTDYSSLRDFASAVSSAGGAVSEKIREVLSDSKLLTSATGVVTFPAMAAGITSALVVAGVSAPMAAMVAAVVGVYGVHKVLKSLSGTGLIDIPVAATEGEKPKSYAGLVPAHSEVLGGGMMMGILEDIGYGWDEANELVDAIPGPMRLDDFARWMDLDVGLVTNVWMHRQRASMGERKQRYIDGPYDRDEVAAILERLGFADALKKASQITKRGVVTCAEIAETIGIQITRVSDAAMLMAREDGKHEKYSMESVRRLAREDSYGYFGAMETNTGQPGPWPQDGAVEAAFRAHPRSNETSLEDFLRSRMGRHLADAVSSGRDVVKSVDEMLRWFFKSGGGRIMGGYREKKEKSVPYVGGELQAWRLGDDFAESQLAHGVSAHEIRSMSNDKEFVSDTLSSALGQDTPAYGEVEAFGAAMRSEIDDHVRGGMLTETEKKGRSSRYAMGPARAHASGKRWAVEMIRSGAEEMDLLDRILDEEEVAAWMHDLGYGPHPTRDEISAFQVGARRAAKGMFTGKNQGESMERQAKKRRAYLTPKDGDASPRKKYSESRAWRAGHDFAVDHLTDYGKGYNDLDSRDLRDLSTDEEFIGDVLLGMFDKDPTPGEIEAFGVGMRKGIEDAVRQGVFKERDPGPRNRYQDATQPPPAPPEPEAETEQPEEPKDLEKSLLERIQVLETTLKELKDLAGMVDEEEKPEEEEPEEETEGSTPPGEEPESPMATSEARVRSEINELRAQLQESRERAALVSITDRLRRGNYSFVEEDLPTIFDGCLDDEVIREKKFAAYTRSLPKAPGQEGVNEADVKDDEGLLSVYADNPPARERAAAIMVAYQQDEWLQKNIPLETILKQQVPGGRWPARNGN